MDAIALLVADHNRVNGLFSRYEKAHEKGQTVETAELVEKIAEELRIHMLIEEKVFYPAVHGLKEKITEQVDEGIEEHHVAKVILKELTSLSPTDPTWAAKVTVLIENVKHHVEEEEKDLFPAIRGATDAKWLNGLADKLEAKKKALGAPLLADKIGMSTGELTVLASAQQIPGRSSMNHDQLAAAVAPE